MSSPARRLCSFLRVCREGQSGATICEFDDGEGGYVSMMAFLRIVIRSSLSVGHDPSGRARGHAFPKTGSHLRSGRGRLQRKAAPAALSLRRGLLVRRDFGEQHRKACSVRAAISSKGSKHAGTPRGAVTLGLGLRRLASFALLRTARPELRPGRSCRTGRSSHRSGPSRGRAGNLRSSAWSAR